MASSTTPLYVAECSPVAIRGKIVSGYPLFISTGILISSLITVLFAQVGPNGWRWFLDQFTLFPSLSR